MNRKIVAAVPEPAPVGEEHLQLVENAVREVKNTMSTDPTKDTTHTLNKIQARASCARDESQMVEAMVAAQIEIARGLNRIAAVLESNTGGR